MTSEPARGWQIAIDRGGTFTDVVAVREDVVHTAKVLSDDPDRDTDAILAGIRAVIEEGDSIQSVRLGTTVATNALLTRGGEPTALVLTAGLGDLPVLGDQSRPRLFDLDIQRPAPIASRVIEAAERISVDGEVLLALDEEALCRDLREARQAGMVAVGICLLHGWRHDVHERRVAELAAVVGFEEIVTSGVSPMQGLVARQDTVAVDACLSPPLARSIDALRTTLGDTPLLCMQSTGGLVEADRFRGGRAILSGPAGGLLGAVREAQSHGIDRIVAMDMGGTSTDVSWFGGALERRTDTVVGGVRLRMPMLRVQSVASGGGSICAYRGGRLRVGPGSAGADPGPACYRLGGPATVTDCHVALGRLPVEALPAVFGSSRDQVIDADAARGALGCIARDAGSESLEHCAAGLLDVAVERIGNAMRTVSVERGHDLRGAALVAFGGAGGQVACGVADRLGLDAVLVPRRAGVLSAMGIASADLRAVRTRTVGAPLDAGGFEAAHAEIALARNEALGELGVEATREAVQVGVRATGWDRSLQVPLDSVEAMAESFRDACRVRLGYEAAGALMIDTVEIEVVCSCGLETGEVDANGPLTTARATSRAWFEGAWRDVPIVHCRAVEAIDGPAIVLDEGSTTVVEPGWRARRTDRGGLHLERVEARESSRVDIADPAMIEVLNHRFLTICREMGYALQHTASSVNIKERLDYSCAIFDARGRLVANGPHMPVHLGSMGASVQHVLSTFRADMDRGNAWVLNDPARGGTHLPDLTVITPVLDVPGGELKYLLASRGHHADVGGTTPGSMPSDSTTLEQEGVVLDAVPLCRGGLLLEDEVRARLSGGTWPARNPSMVLDDLRAQLAANARGEVLLAQMEQAFGPDGVEAGMKAVRANASECVRAAMAGRPAGRFEAPMDDGAIVCVAVETGPGGRTRIDFTGTSSQRPGNTNAPAAVTSAAVLYVLRCLVDDEIPLNDGCLEAVDLVIPRGSMLDPLPGAAVVGGNVETSQVVVDALLGALGVQAASQGTMNNLTFGTKSMQYYETICGGAGAGPGFDGASGVHVHMTNSRLTDPEVLEARFPVRIERFSLRDGSGGAGVHRGGDGVERVIRFLESLTVSLLSNRRETAPHGLNGGGAGATGSQYVVRADGSRQVLPGRFRMKVEPGDQLVILTPGGGGYGTI